MTEHEAFLAYTPRGPGLMCALLYFTIERDVYGWWTGFHDYRYLPAYFKLENFYAPEDTAFLATEGSDLYAGWRYDYSRSVPLLDPPLPIDDSDGGCDDDKPVKSFKAWSKQHEAITIGDPDAIARAAEAVANQGKAK